MDPAEALASTKILMLKIHVITGWMIPEAELKNILIDQLAKKIHESYGHANSEEFEFAFRNNTTVKDWGKAMNLAMFDEVMAPYLSKRVELSMIEESKAPVALIEYPEIKMTDEELLIATHETWKIIPTPDIIPEAVYFHLQGEGKINLTIEQKNDISSRVERNNLSKELFKVQCRKVTVHEYFKSLNTSVLIKASETGQWNQVK